jgi:formylglycine-generating enzyme required for sulfatase activity
MGNSAHIEDNWIKQMTKKRMTLLQLLALLIPLLLLSCATTQTGRSVDYEPEVINRMVVIPRGWFVMGTDAGVLNERPEHEVFLESYLIDLYEVSAEEFAEFLNDRGNPDGKYFSHDLTSTIIGVYYDKNGRPVETEEDPEEYMPREGFEKHPANNVSWFGADAYCLWKAKRLPTEAEWEKAARGVDARTYPWGNSEPDPTKARYSQHWNKKGLNVMVTVQSMPAGASPLKAQNLSGNVWEWVSDWYRRNYCDFCYQANFRVPPRSNPIGPSTGNFKVLRGGSWLETYGSLVIKSTHRYWLEPEDRKLNTGFRCVKDFKEDDNKEGSE